MLTIASQLRHTRRLRLYLTLARQCCRSREIVRRQHPDSQRLLVDHCHIKGRFCHGGSPFWGILSWSERSKAANPRNRGGLIIRPDYVQGEREKGWSTPVHRAWISDFNSAPTSSKAATSAPSQGRVVLDWKARPSAFGGLKAAYRPQVLQ